MGTRVFNGYAVTIEGTHSDLVKFYFNGTLIASDNIRNGDGLGSNDVIPGLDISLGNQNLVSVRHGSLRDLVSVYALVNGVVYRSKEWGDYGPGQVANGVVVTSQPNAYYIQGFPFNSKDVAGHDGAGGIPTSISSYGRIAFDFNSLTFSYDVGNGAAFSTDPNRQEKKLYIEP